MDSNGMQISVTREKQSSYHLAALTVLFYTISKKISITDKIISCAYFWFFFSSVNELQFYVLKRRTKSLINCLTKKNTSYSFYIEESLEMNLMTSDI